jgi:hypothetical protein
MNAMLANLKLPVEEKVEVTYTTHSGEVVTTRKPIRPLGHTFVLSGLATMLCTFGCVGVWVCGCGCVGVCLISVWYLNDAFVWTLLCCQVSHACGVRVCQLQYRTLQHKNLRDK